MLRPPYKYLLVVVGRVLGVTKGRGEGVGRMWNMEGDGERLSGTLSGANCLASP